MIGAALSNARQTGLDRLHAVREMLVNRSGCADQLDHVVGPLYAVRTEFGPKFGDIFAAEGVPVAVR
jgi:hypothetical protein